MASQIPSDDQLQCPFSNCFPLLYEDCSGPCAVTAFKGYSRLNEHIWVYHSYLFSCEHCDSRVSKNYVKGELLERKKQEHWKKYHKPDTGREQSQVAKHRAHIMTAEKDLHFKSWADEERGRRRGNDKYFTLCRTLFGDDIEPPENPGYDYLIPKHRTKSSSRKRGERNLAYVERYLANGDQRQEEASQSTFVQAQPNMLGLLSPWDASNPLTLIPPGENGTAPQQWTNADRKTTNDSGYVTKQESFEVDCDMEALPSYCSAEGPPADCATSTNPPTMEPRDTTTSNDILESLTEDTYGQHSDAFLNPTWETIGYTYPTSVEGWFGFEAPDYDGYGT